MTKGELNDLLKELIDASFDSGYYQAVMEKQAATLSDMQLKEYAMLNRLAIARRVEMRGRILDN